MAAVIYGEPRFTRDEMVIAVAPVEYVMIRKLEYFRASGSDRPLRDVATILRVSGERLDESELGRWVARLELDEQLRAAEDFEL